MKITIRVERPDFPGSFIQATKVCLVQNYLLKSFPFRRSLAPSMLDTLAIRKGERSDSCFVNLYDPGFRSAENLFILLEKCKEPLADNRKLIILYALCNTIH